MWGNPKLVAMSHTAPKVTEDDLKREFESFSPEQQCAVQYDVHGMHALTRETPALCQDWLRQLQEEIDAMPDTQKVDYRAAVEACPQLIQSETDAMNFLRTDDYNPKAAAARLVSYWKARRHIFGDRAFLPLNQLAGGALDSDDLEFLQSGKIQLLNRDAHGRTMIYHFRNQMNRFTDVHIRTTRCLMYFLRVVGDDPRIYQHGFVLINDLEKFETSEFDRKATGLFYQLLRESLPLKLRALYACFPAMKCAQKLVVPATLWIMGPHIRHRTLIVSGSRVEQQVELEHQGIDPFDLPSLIGGTYSVEDYRNLLNDRRQHEDTKLREQEGPLTDS